MFRPIDRYPLFFRIHDTFPAAGRAGIRTTGARYSETSCGTFHQTDPP